MEISLLRIHVNPEGLEHLTYYTVVEMGLNLVSMMCFASGSQFLS